MCAILWRHRSHTQPIISRNVYEIGTFMKFFWIKLFTYFKFFIICFILIINLFLLLNILFYKGKFKKYKIIR